MTMFRQGLKPQVKAELMRTGASTESLDDLINTAIDIDVKLHELQLELRDDPRARVALTDRRPPPRNPWRSNPNRNQRSGRYQPNMGRRIHNDTGSGYYGPAAMDLSNINRVPERLNKKQSKGSKPDKSKMTCYRCGKQGHFARDCRMKNKVVRQLNVLTIGDGGVSEEWEVLTEDMGRLMEDTESERGSVADCVDNDGRYDRMPTPYNKHKNAVTVFAEPVARQGRQRQRENPMKQQTTGQEELQVPPQGSVRAKQERNQRPVREVLSSEFVRFSNYQRAYEYDGDGIQRGTRYVGNLFEKDGHYYAPDGREILVVGSTKLRELNEQRRKRRQELNEARNINYSPRQQDNWCDKQLALRDQEVTDDDEDDGSDIVEIESDEEEYEEAEEYRDHRVTRARARLAEDGAGLTGLNRQIANSKKTDID